jgi:hypothetical protein
MAVPFTATPASYALWTAMLGTFSKGDTAARTRPWPRLYTDF